MSSSYRGYYINGNPDIGYTAEHTKTGEQATIGQRLTLAGIKRAIDASIPAPAVGVKLFDKENKVVHELDAAPEGIGHAALVVHRGIHYSYRGLMDNSQWRNAPYARFDECAPPYELV